MEPNRPDRFERDRSSKDDHRDLDSRQAAGDEGEELDGQLGPDELPDADEVVMNLEAKRHH